PVVNFLDAKLRLPRSLASLLTVLGLIGIISAGVTLFTTQLISGVPAMRDSARQGVNQIINWLETGPFKLTQAQLSDMVNHVRRGAYWEDGGPLGRCPADLPDQPVLLPLRGTADLAVASVPRSPGIPSADG